MDREILISSVERPEGLNSCSRDGQDRQRPSPAPEPNLAEKTLWTLVRNRRLGGFKFLRQVAIDRYFADFVCEAAKVIVELDGPTHDGREDYDSRRTEILELFGYIVLRFRNERVLADPGGTADDILAVLRSARV